MDHKGHLPQVSYDNLHSTRNDQDSYYKNIELLSHRPSYPIQKQRPRSTHTSETVLNSKELHESESETADKPAFPQEPQTQRTISQGSSNATTNTSLSQDEQSSEDVTKRILFFSPSADTESRNDHNTSAATVISQNDSVPIPTDPNSTVSSTGNESRQTKGPSLYDYVCNETLKNSYSNSNPLLQHSRVSRFHYDPPSRNATFYSHPRPCTSPSHYYDYSTPSNKKFSNRNHYPMQGMHASRIAYEQDCAKNSSGTRIYYDHSYNQNHCSENKVRMHYVAPKTSPMFVDRYSHRIPDENMRRRRAFGDVTNLDPRGRDMYSHETVGLEEHGDRLEKKMFASNFPGDRKRQSKDHPKEPYSNSPNHNSHLHVSPQTEPTNSSVVRYCTPILTNNERRRTANGVPLSQDEDSTDALLKEHYDDAFPSHRPHRYVYGKISPSRYGVTSPQHTRHLESPLSYATPVLARTTRSSNTSYPVPPPLVSYVTAYPHDEHTRRSQRNPYPYPSVTPSLPPHLPFHPTSVGYYSPYAQDHPSTIPSPYPFSLHKIRDMHPLHVQEPPSKKRRPPSLPNRKLQPSMVNPRAGKNAAKPPRRKKMYSDFVGVTYNKTHAKYQACITHYRKQHYLGRYKLAVDAARAYDESAKLLKGNGWKINFPTLDDYERAKTKEVQDNNKKRYDAGLPPASDNVDLAISKISVPLSVQETVAAESVAPYGVNISRYHTELEETKIYQPQTNNRATRNVGPQNSHVQNERMKTMEPNDRRTQMVMFGNAAHPTMSTLENFTKMRQEGYSAAATSAVTPSPHPMSQQPKALSLLTEPLMSPLATNRMTSPIAKGFEHDTASKALVKPTQSDTIVDTWASTRISGNVSTQVVEQTKEARSTTHGKPTVKPCKELNIKESTGTSISKIMFQSPTRPILRVKNCSKENISTRVPSKSNSQPIVEAGKDASESVTISPDTW